MKYDPILKTIDDPVAPERLRGKVVTITLDPEAKSLDFAVDVPDDATANELGYLRLRIGEFVEGLREQFPWIGERTEILKS